MLSDEIRTKSELDDVINQSREHGVFVFKHSTRCPVSAAALAEVQAYQAEPDPLPVYLLKVVESRPISVYAEATLDVEHESPQLILLRGGKAVWDISHGEIDLSAIKRAIELYAG